MFLPWQVPVTAGTARRVIRVETGKQTYGEYPSEALIRRLAHALDGDEEELLLLAEKIPERIRRRFFEQPVAFRELAEVDDATLHRVLAMIGSEK